MSEKRASRKEMERSNSLSRIENSCLEPIALVFPRRVERHVLLEVPSTSRQEHCRTTKTTSNVHGKTLNVTFDLAPLCTV
jgi:hypothetical protein